MRFLLKTNEQTKTIHFRYSVLTMTATMVETHIRTTLRTLISDGVPLLRHAHVSNALCNRDVYRSVASNGQCIYGKSHEIV